MSASLHEVFIERLADLQTQSGQLKRAESTTDTQRVWMYPSDWSGNPFNIPGIHLPSFDRTPININYQEVANSKTDHVGDAASLKVQLDTVAQMERAFRLRHASGLRCIMHAAARHGGQGSDQGVFSAVRNYAQDLWKSGGGD